MKTKIISILAILLFSLTFVTAQNRENVSLGILGGVNFQNLNEKDHNGDKLENKLIVGYHFGVNVQIPIVPEFYFQPGLLFSVKGAKNDDHPVITSTRLSYIEMPLNFVYKGSLGEGYVLVGLGPYLGYAVTGNVKYHEGESASQKKDIVFQNVVELDDPMTVPYYKAFDVGANIFFGYETAFGIFAQLNAQLGLVKINPDYAALSDDKSAIRNTGFGVSIGYQF